MRWKRCTLVANNVDYYWHGYKWLTVDWNDDERIPVYWWGCAAVARVAVHLQAMDVSCSIEPSSTHLVPVGICDWPHVCWGVHGLLTGRVNYTAGFAAGIRWVLQINVDG